MPNAANQPRASSTSESVAPAPTPKKHKLSSFLVTADTELWPQVGTHLTHRLVHRQIDSVEELLAAIPADQPGVILWDARGAADRLAVIARLQSHSSRFAIVALDDADGAADWAQAMQLGQVVGFVQIPIDTAHLTDALATAYEEVNARVALLGSGAVAPLPSGAPRRVARPPRRRLWIGAAAVGVLLLCVLVVLLLRQSDDALIPAPNGTAAPPAQGSTPAAPGAEEKVDALIAEAQHAMHDRHFIEPAEGSALSLYRSALVLDPASGEARQGLQRLAEILLARVQSSLDERQFDAALQALETVRSINPGDARLAALDERISKMRSELGPSEVMASINAENFDRAVQLIEDASRSKSISEPKLAQLREELRRHRAQQDVAHLVTLIDARLQQDQLAEPPNDSAAYYLGLARRAGATPAELQSQTRELVRRITTAVHTAVEQRNLNDADRLTAELRAAGAPLSATAGLQHDIGVARAQLAHEQSDESKYVDLAHARLAQGSVTAPENDNALYYLNQLRASDPQNAALSQLSKAVQSQILTQVRAALDGGQPAQADPLLQLAAGLGGSPELDALADRLRFIQYAAANAPKEVAEASLTRTKKLDVDYPANALERKIEGTVEIGYTVTAKGTVADIKVLDANPQGVFEKAATNAVSRLRYKPVLDGGKPLAVATKMLVIFRLAT